MFLGCSPQREAAAMFYGVVVRYPRLIVVQIVCLQCLYYLTLGLFMTILVGTRVSRLSLMYFFDFSTLTAVTTTGWCAIASFLLTSIAGAVYMLYLIERTKKCLDFAATLYIIHVFICMVYGGWPSTVTWWVVSITCLAVMPWRVVVHQTGTARNAYYSASFKYLIYDSYLGYFFLLLASNGKIF